MSREEIESFIKRNQDIENAELVFELKKRNPISGFLVKAGDHQFLHSKNFWHIVTLKNRADWIRSGNRELLLIISGEAFIKIRPVR